MSCSGHSKADDDDDELNRSLLYGKQAVSKLQSLFCQAFLLVARMSTLCLNSSIFVQRTHVFLEEGFWCPISSAFLSSVSSLAQFKSTDSRGILTQPQPLVFQRAE